MAKALQFYCKGARSRTLMLELTSHKLCSVEGKKGRLTLAVDHIYRITSQKHLSLVQFLGTRAWPR